MEQADLAQQDTGVSQRSSFNESLLKTQPVKWNKEQNLLVILIEFNDYKLTTTEEEWYQKIFDQQSNSASKYFATETNDRINIKPVGDTEHVKNGILKIQSDQNHPGTVDSFSLAADSLQQIKDKIDFSIYDTNKNNQIELNELHIMFVIAGFERSTFSSEKGVWGHKGYHSALTTVNGIKFTDFTMFGERMRLAGKIVPSTIGVICHEFGHDLGLPDLYNTDKINGVSDGEGLGPISTMAGGSWGADILFNGIYWLSDLWGSTPVALDAYSKIQLGVPFEEINIAEKHEKTVSIGSDGDPTILKLQSKNPNEYFLIENRQVQGYDIGIRHFSQNISGGIAVYRVNTDYGQNYGVGRQLVKILEADENILGYSRYETNSSSNTNPFFYQGNALAGGQQPTIINAESTPSTILADGSDLGIEIKVLSASGGDMKVSIGEKEPVPLQDIILNKQHTTLDIGQTEQLTAKLSPEDTTETGLVWKSDNEKVAIVDGTGKVTGISRGNAKITVASTESDKTATCQVLVGDDYENTAEKADLIEFDKEYSGQMNYAGDADYVSYLVENGDLIAMESTTRPRTASGYDEATQKWTSLSTDSRLGHDGKYYSKWKIEKSYTRIAIGFTSGYTDQNEYQFTTKKVQKVDPTLLNPEELRVLKVGETVQIKAIANNGGFSGSLNYSSSLVNSHLKISHDGKLTGVSAGQETVTILDGATGAYVQFTIAVGDDYANSANNSANLEFDKEYNGQLNYAGDADYVSYPVATGDLIAMESTTKPRLASGYDEATKKWTSLSTDSKLGHDGKYYSKWKIEKAYTRIAIGFTSDYTDQNEYQFTTKKVRKVDPTLLNPEELRVLKVGETVQIKAIANNGGFSGSLNYSSSLVNSHLEISHDGKLTGVSAGQETVTILDGATGAYIQVSINIQEK